MKATGPLLAWCALVAASPLWPQGAQPAPDPITGTWSGQPPGVVFELQFDGKHKVSGKVTPQPGLIKKGTFDRKTGVLKLEGDGWGPDGSPCRFVIEGKVDDAKATGTEACGNKKVADFSVTKQ